MSHRYCESPACKGQTIAGIRLDAVGPFQLRRGHGFVVGASATSPGLVVCGRCARTSTRTSTRPKKSRPRRPTT